MDGENNGKALLKWMIWGENPLFLETPIYRPYLQDCTCFYVLKSQRFVWFFHNYLRVGRTNPNPPCRRLKKGSLISPSQKKVTLNYQEVSFKKKIITQLEMGILGCFKQMFQTYHLSFHCPLFVASKLSRFGRELLLTPQVFFAFFGSHRLD